MADIEIGVNPLETQAAGEVPKWKVGTLASASDSITGTVKDFMYVKSTAGITDAGYVGYIDPVAFDATMVTTANTATAPKIGYPIGVAQAAIVAGGFGWLQVYGQCQVRTGAAITAGSPVSSFTTAGTLNTGITTGAAKFSGVAITVTAAGVQLTSAFLSYPQVANVNL